MMLSTILKALPVAALVSATFPKGILVWSVQAPEVAVFQLSADGSMILGRQGQLTRKFATSDGSQVSVDPPGKSSLLWKSLTPHGPKLGQGTAQSECLWDTPLCKIGVNNVALFEYEPGTDLLISKVRWDSIKGLLPIQGFGGEPDRGALMIGTISEVGRMEELDHLFMTHPLRETKLDFFAIDDFSDLRAVLGHSWPKGSSFDHIETGPQTSDTPLSCGDAFSGKILWRNESCDRGRWIGNYVLTKRKDNSKWVLLRSKDGKEVRCDLAGLQPELVPGQNVQVRGMTYYVLTHAPVRLEKYVLSN